MKTAIILASGPSLTDEQIDAARKSGHHTIAINSTWEKMLDANVLYAGDFLWWKVNIERVRKSFHGACWTQDSSAAARWATTLQHMRGANRDGLGSKMIYTNGNSGMQALNLAYLWGFERIILLGFDMRLGPNGEKHHHADHPKPMVQGQTFHEWMVKAEKIAVDLKRTNCRVINCTPESALRAFPMHDWREVLL